MRFYATAVLSCAICFTALLFIYGAEESLGQFAVPAVFVGIFVVLSSTMLWFYRNDCIAYQPGTMSAIETAVWNCDHRSVALVIFFIMLSVSVLFLMTVVFVNSGIDFVHSYRHLNLGTHIVIYFLFGITVITGWFSYTIYKIHAHNIVIAMERAASVPISTSAIYLSSGQRVELIPDKKSIYGAADTTSTILKDRNQAQLSLPSGLISLLRE